MANLEHPNIVKLRGVAQSVPEGFASGHKTGYFLLLDRLYGTLEEKLQVWHRQSQKASSNFIKRSVLDRKGEKRQGLLAVRMKVAFDVAGALAFLHSRGVIYRDLVSSLLLLYSTSVFGSVSFLFRTCMMDRAQHRHLPSFFSLYLLLLLYVFRR